MNLLLSRKTCFWSNHRRFMGKLTAEQSECLCQKIDKLTWRGLLADWGYAVPMTPPSPSPAINDLEPRLPGSSTTPNEPLLSVADKPLLEADSIPLVTDPFNQTPTSPIELPTTEDAKCVNYVPVVGVGSSNLRTTLHQKKPVMPYIAICYNRVLYITISALCCTKCNNSIMASKAYPPYL